MSTSHSKTRAFQHLNVYVLIQNVYFCCDYQLTSTIQEIRHSVWLRRRTSKLRHLSPPPQLPRVRRYSLRLLRLAGLRCTHPSLPTPLHTGSRTTRCLHCMCQRLIDVKRQAWNHGTARLWLRADNITKSACHVWFEEIRLNNLKIETNNMTSMNAELYLSIMNVRT